MRLRAVNVRELPAMRDNLRVFVDFLMKIGRFRQTR
jgi:hypothetical protein